MSVFAAPGAYDRAITVFSPDGRLFQVEYALETVNRGATILGLACSEGIVLGAEEKIESPLQDQNFSWKLYEVDEVSFDSSDCTYKDSCPDAETLTLYMLKVQESCFLGCPRWRFASHNVYKFI